MKKAQIILVMLITMMSTQADSHSLQNGYSAQTESSIQPNTYLSSNIAQDLALGTWTVDNSSNSGTKSMYLFDISGDLMILTTGMDFGTSVEAKTWEVTEYDNKTFLSVGVKGEQKDELYEINKSQDGILLSNVLEAKEIKLDFMPSPSTSKQSKELVFGSWHSASYPFEIASNFDNCGSFEPIRGAFFNLDLNRDGSYSKSWGGELQQFNTKGQWIMAAGGTQLLLLNDKGISGEAYTVESLHGNKIFLKGSIQSTSSVYCTPIKVFAMSITNI